MINNYCLFRFLGLSQSLPVTSYIKMIDIWMLFTMTIPFLEVVLHTTNEVSKRPRASHVALGPKVDLIEVKSASNGEEEMQEEEGNTNTSIRPTLTKLMGNLMLPIASLVFTVIFWVVGFIQSLSSADIQHFNLSDCKTIDRA